MTLLMRLGALGLLASVALVACSDDDPFTRAREPASSPSTVAPPLTTPPPELPSPDSVGGCANAAEVAGNALNRTAGPLIGDVTGDGTPERLYLSLDQGAPLDCQAFLVVSETSTTTAPIEGWDSAAGVASPSFQGLAQIDGRPGAEIIVNLAAGASTQFVGVFSASGGTIERVTTSGDEAAAGSSDLFAYGGSVGHLEAVDCTEDGRVVLSSAIPKGNRYQVNRRFFLPSGSSLDFQPEARRAVVTLNELEDLPEFGASPFGTCPPA